MSRNTLVRLSGWAMMIGGAASALGLMTFVLREAFGMVAVPKGSAWEAILVVAFFYGPVGVGMGLLGIRERFGPAVGSLGGGALLVGGVAGTALIVIGDVVQSLPNTMDDNGFGYFMYGLFVVFVSLELYGILAVVRRPQARWNGLALVAGLPITLLAVLVAVMGSGGNGPNPILEPWAAAFAASFAAMGVALVVLGYQTQSDLPEGLTAEPAGA